MKINHSKHEVIIKIKYYRNDIFYKQQLRYPSKGAFSTSMNISFFLTKLITKTWTS